MRPQDIAKQVLVTRGLTASLFDASFTRALSDLPVIDITYRTEPRGFPPMNTREAAQEKSNSCRAGARRDRRAQIASRPVAARSLPGPAETPRTLTDRVVPAAGMSVRGSRFGERIDLRLTTIRKNVTGST
jgi:hypothetical protein